MKHYVLEPDVHPPNISHLHVIMEGWFGDDILESFPCYVVTKKLAKSNFSGIAFEEMSLTISEQFDVGFPNVTLPIAFPTRALLHHTYRRCSGR